MSRLKKYIIWIIVLAIIGAVVYFFANSQKSATEYTTETVTRGDLAQTVSVTGEIVAENEARPGFQIGGEISQVFFEVGDRVEKGARLAQIKAGTQITSLHQSQKSLEAQKQTYKDIKEKDDIYSDEQRRSQRAIVEQYEAAVEGAAVNLARTIIYSPIDGIVTTRSIEIGEVVNPASPVFIIMGEGGLEIRSDVPESDIVKVLLGQNAEVTFDALPSDEILKAEVIEIEPAATVIQDVVYYRVKLKFEADARIKPGMSADIDIRTAEKSDVVMVPLRAVKTEGEKEYVEILKIREEQKFTEKVYVKTGLHGDDGMVEIVSGLKGGEEVVTLTKAQ